MNSLKLNSVIVKKTLGPLLFSRNIHGTAVLCDKSLYELLRVPENATQSEIKQAYYKLSKVYHPDMKPDESSLRMFRSITEAYDILGNVNKRMQYDKGVLGKSEHYDPTKEEFYGSLFRNNAASVAHHFKIKDLLDHRQSMDKYLDNQYNDRIGEYQIFKKQHYDPKLTGFSGFDTKRFCIVLGFCAIACGLRYLEFCMSW